MIKVHMNDQYTRRNPHDFKVEKFSSECTNGSFRRKWNIAFIVSFFESDLYGSTSL